MRLKFEKWHGCKNDFLITKVAWADQLTRGSLRDRSQWLCSRKGDGVGADGIIILHPDGKDDLFPRRMTIINSDGSVAAICGNGIRCAALSVIRGWRTEGNPHDVPSAIEFEVVGDGERLRQVFCRFVGSVKSGTIDGQWPMVSVAMGIGLTGSQVLWRADFERILREAIGVLPSLAPELKDWEIADIGNPHVIFTTSHASAELVRLIGPALQKGASWGGINVHLVTPSTIEQKSRSRLCQLFQDLGTDGYKAFTWERGAGETQACGSGACAVGVVALARSEQSRTDWIPVEMPGGLLLVKQEIAGEDVTLAGPGEFVFEGWINF